MLDGEEKNHSSAASTGNAGRECHCAARPVSRGGGHPPPGPRGPRGRPSPRGPARPSPWGTGEAQDTSPGAEDTRGREPTVQAAGESQVRGRLEAPRAERDRQSCPERAGARTGRGSHAGQGFRKAGPGVGLGAALGEVARYRPLGPRTSRCQTKTADGWASPPTVPGSMPAPSAALRPREPLGWGSTPDPPRTGSACAPRKTPGGTGVPGHGCHANPTGPARISLGGASQPLPPGSSGRHLSAAPAAAPATKTPTDKAEAPQAWPRKGPRPRARPEAGTRFLLLCACPQRPGVGAPRHGPQVRAHCRAWRGPQRSASAHSDVTSLTFLHAFFSH